MFRAQKKINKKSNLLTLVMLCCTAYFLLPLIWLFITTTKDTTGIYSSFGLWFTKVNHLFANVKEVFSLDDGLYVHWMVNTTIYAVVGATGAALIATAAGYGFSKYDFGLKKPLFGVVLGSVMIPMTALAIPTFLVFSKIHLVNTRWAIILPSLISPIGVYLMRVYSDTAVSQNLLEAARIDGLGELRIFFSISLRLLMPGFITVVLLSIVSIWNNYFLPLIMLNSPNLQPLTVGLSGWAQSSISGASGGDSSIQAAVITGSAISLIPLIIVFLILQRFWENGLSAGSNKE
ncbi:MAG TPA: carbohydrate ABC transporter permease [Candidatus Nanopelagicaceae bacterium]